MTNAGCLSAVHEERQQTDADRSEQRHDHDRRTFAAREAPWATGSEVRDGRRRHLRSGQTQIQPREEQREQREIHDADSEREHDAHEREHGDEQQQQHQRARELRRHHSTHEIHA